jgi:hypothetical protein
MKKICLVLLILAVVGGAAFSFDLKSFPSPIKPGSLLLNPTVNMGSYGASVSGGGSSETDTGGFGLGITLSADYALPIPLTVGLETGFGTAFDDDFDGIVIPILARVAWHPNFEVPNLDTYITLKLGYSVATGDGLDGGFSGGGNVGARYFFSPKIAVFGELGYDRYTMGSDEINIPGFYGYGGYKLEWSYYMYTWFHTGITILL